MIGVLTSVQGTEECLTSIKCRRLETQACFSSIYLQCYTFLKEDMNCVRQVFFDFCHFSVPLTVDFNSGAHFNCLTVLLTDFGKITGSLQSLLFPIIE